MRVGGNRGKAVVARLIAILGLLLAVTFVHTTRAQAATLNGPLTVTAPASFDRGGAAQTVTVAIPTDSGSTFTLGLSTPFAAAAAGSCSTGIGSPVSCSYGGGTVTVTPFPFPFVTISVTATVTLQVSVSSTFNLSSTEALNPSMSVSGVSLTATATAGLLSQTGNATTTVNAAPTDAIVSLSTTNSPATIDRSTSTPKETYTATLTLAQVATPLQIVVANVSLAPSTDNGTSIASSNPAIPTVVFTAADPAGTQKKVVFTITTPTTATLGATSGRSFSVSYNPNSTVASDTRTGSTATYTITGPPPTLAVALSSPVPTGTTIARGSNLELDLTVTNVISANPGAGDATGVQVTLPVSDQLQIGVGATSGGGSIMVNPSPPQSVTISWPKVSQGTPVTATLPTTVKTNAVKNGTDPVTDPDIRVGPAKGTYSPPNNSSIPQSGTLGYMIRPDADLTVSVSSNSPTLNPNTADIVATYLVKNNGPDSAATPKLVANPPAGVTGAVISPPNDTICSTSTNIVTCNLPDLNSGSTFNGSTGIVITWTVNSSGTKSLPATVSSTTNDPVPANNSTTGSVTVANPNANMTASAAANPTTATVAGGTSPINDSVTVTYKFKSTGPDTVNATFSVAAPAGTTLQTLTPSSGTCPVGPYAGTVTCSIPSLQKDTSVSVAAQYTVTAVALPGPVTFSASVVGTSPSTVTPTPTTASAVVSLQLPAVQLTGSDSGAPLEVLNIPVGSATAQSAPRTFTVATDPSGSVTAPGPYMKIGLPSGVSILSNPGCTTDAVADTTTFPGAATTLKCAATPDPAGAGGQTPAATSPVTFVIQSANASALTVQYVPSSDTTLRRLLPVPALKSFKLDINFLPTVTPKFGPVLPVPASLTYQVLIGDGDGGDGNGTGADTPGTAVAPVGFLSTLTVRNPTVVSIENGSISPAPVLTLVNSNTALKVDVASVTPTAATASQGVTLTVGYEVFDGSGATQSTLKLNLRPSIPVLANTNFGYTRGADPTPPKSLGLPVDPTLFGARPSTINPLLGDLGMVTTSVTGTLAPAPTAYNVVSRSTPTLDSVGAVNSLVQPPPSPPPGTPTNAVISYTAPRGYTTDPDSTGARAPHDGFTYNTSVPNVFDAQGSVDIAIQNANPIPIDDTATVLNATTAEFHPLLNDADGNTRCAFPPAGSPAGTPACVAPDPKVTVKGVTYTFDDENRSADPTLTGLQICAIGPVPALVGGKPPTPICPDPNSTTLPPAFVALGLSPANKPMQMTVGNGKLTAELRSAPHAASASVPGVARAAADPFTLADAFKVIDLSPDAVASGGAPLAYIVADPRGGLGWGQINITVPNTPPAVVGDVQTVLKNTPKIVVDATGIVDVNKNVVLIQSIQQQPQHGIAKISFDNKTILYSPNTNYLGPDKFSYTVNDGRSDGSASATVQIQVVDTPMTQVAGAGGTSPAGTLPKTGTDPLALTFAGGASVVLGAALSLFAARRRERYAMPLHARK